MQLTSQRVCYQLNYLQSFKCSVNLRIQPEYRKMRTRKNFVFGHFSRSGLFKHPSSAQVPECPNSFSPKCPSAQISFECPSLLSAQVPGGPKKHECLSTCLLSGQVPSKCPIGQYYGYFSSD